MVGRAGDTIQVYISHDDRRHIGCRHRSGAVNPSGARKEGILAIFGNVRHNE